MNRQQRSYKDANIPKCSCGNNLSLSRQKSGIDCCPACEQNDPSHDNYYTIDDAIDSINTLVNKCGVELDFYSWKIVLNHITH